LGIPGVTDALDRMLTVDFIIANEDRHLNNFGAVRCVDTLEWIGTAPVYDSGTSMWCHEPVAMVRPRAKLPSKPFRPSHAEQIGLVTSFGWLDWKSLSGIDEELRKIFSGTAFKDEARRDALCYGIRKRVEQLSEHARSIGRSREPRHEPER